MCMRKTPRNCNSLFLLCFWLRRKLTRIPVTITWQQTFHLPSDNLQNRYSCGVSNKPLGELSPVCSSTIACNHIPWSMNLIGWNTVTNDGHEITELFQSESKQRPSLWFPYFIRRRPLELLTFKDGNYLEDYIYRFISYRAVNTIRLCYKNQSVNPI
jgi:hypothetical protein